MPQRKKTLARNLGEFFGHIIKGVKSDPARPKKQVVRKEVEEEDRGDMVLRRTTIEEVEFKKKENEDGETEDTEKAQS